MIVSRTKRIDSEPMMSFQPEAGKRARRAQLLRRFLFVCLFWLLWQATAHADVRASLERSKISLNETVSLAIEADGVQDSPPDLSALTADFDILHRSTSHQVRVVNGQRVERHVLMLLLRPRRSGDLLIPPVSFGGESTRPLRLSVTGPEATRPPPSTWMPPMALPPPAPEAMNPPSKAGPVPPKSPAPGEGEASPVSPAEPETEPSDESRSGNPWIWIASVLGLAWIATLVAWWRSKTRVAKPPLRPDAVHTDLPVAESNPLREKIDAVRTAYQAADAQSARLALLEWAGQVVPKPIPGNLSQLAQRCPEPLRSQILMLEQAFFSPGHVAWYKQPVWEEMEDFKPLLPQEPASFRQKKPIRRRAADENAR